MGAKMRTLLLTVALALAGIASACGDDDSSNGGDSGTGAGDGAGGSDGSALDCPTAEDLAAVTAFDFGTFTPEGGQGEFLLCGYGDLDSDYSARIQFHGPYDLDEPPASADDDETYETIDVPGATRAWIRSDPEGIVDELTVVAGGLLFDVDVQETGDGDADMTPAEIAVAELVIEQLEG